MITNDVEMCKLPNGQNLKKCIRGKIRQKFRIWSNLALYPAFKSGQASRYKKNMARFWPCRIRYQMQA